jgi:hypothetical protein
MCAFRWFYCKNMSRWTVFWRPNTLHLFIYLFFVQLIPPRQIGQERIKNTIWSAFVARFGLPTVGLQVVTLFGNVISCRLVIVYRRFREGCCLHVENQAVKDQEPEHGVIRLLRNVGNFTRLHGWTWHETWIFDHVFCEILSRGRLCGRHERRAVRKMSLDPYLRSGFLCLKTITFPAWTSNLWHVINRL